MRTPKYLAQQMQVLGNYFCDLVYTGALPLGGMKIAQAEDGPRIKSTIQSKGTKKDAQTLQREPISDL